MFNIILCMGLFALGHLVRDGWPPFKETLLRVGAPQWIVSLSTQFARVTGAAICAFGVIFVAYAPLRASLIVGGVILAGFYTDTKHGEGQNARKWRDVPYLMLSGSTSLLPLAALWGYFGHSIGLMLTLLAFGGMTKTSIWFIAWRVVPVRNGQWLSPTRAAAMAFGATIGALLAFPW